MRNLIPLFLLGALLPIFAGGPIGRLSSGQGVPQDNSVPFVYNIESGPLNDFYSNAMISGLVRQMFAQWNSVAGSTLTIQEGEPIAMDIVTVDQMNAAVEAGLSPIVFDEMGSIFEEMGTSANVLAFAGPRNFNSSTGKYRQMIAVFGGPANASQNTTEVSATLLHEFGHGLGLGHSVVNADSGVSHPFGNSPRDKYEVMYWLARAANTSPLRDDISGFLNLYGNTPQGTSGFGAISGRVLMPDGVTPADGVNVIVRDYSAQGANYFTNAASYISAGFDGSFSISSLPPGTYSVQIYDIARRNRGSYSDPIRTNSANNPSDILGPFPGPEEYYSGPNESNNSDTDIDNPASPFLVQVVADQTASEVNIIFNRQSGIQGSSLPEIYHVPEIQTGDELNTFITLVNPHDSSVTVQVFGFSLSGEMVGMVPGLTTLAPHASERVGILAAFPSNFSNVSWVQVGASDTLHVFAEMVSTTTRSAYMATHGLNQGAIMPHVGKNTARFETVISSVNGNAEGISTELTAVSSNARATLGNHANKYAKARGVLTDLFGADLSAVDWVDVNSSGSGSATMEYFVTLPDRIQMASLNLDNQKGRKLRLLHVATDTNTFWTGMVYINVGQSADVATEVYYSQDGQVLKTHQQNLLPGEKVTLLFDKNTQERVPPGSAWLEVSLPENSVNDLLGYELYGSANPEVLQSFAGLQGNYLAGPVVDYPHFETQPGSYTGIVLINLGESAADVTLSAYDRSGNLLETATVEALAPKTKLVRLLSSGGAPLFSQAETYANGAWVRAESANAQLAGFMVFGDGSGSGDRLSGLEAVILGASDVDNSPTILPETTQPHNTYETAQVLEPINGGWNHNLIGTIQQDGGAGPIVNTCTGCNDGFEDIYSFTLTEPTRLLIATAPTNTNADIDMVIVNSQMPSQDFFGFDYGFSSVVDYSARAGGLESIARVFQPGTYYILVSLFEGDRFSNIGYGLLITQHALYLNTFDDASALTGWTFAASAGDSDGNHNFAFADGFSATKFGGALAQTPPTTGTESSLATSPWVDLPSSGLSFFDFDLGALFTGSITTGNTVSINATSDTNPSTNFSGFQWSTSAEPTPVTYNGSPASFLGWNRYAGGDLPTADFSVGSSFGSQIQLEFRFANQNITQMLDNVRVYQVQSSLTGKREAARLDSPQLRPTKRELRFQIPELLRVPAP